MTFLPNGLSSDPKKFTKLLKPSFVFLRKLLVATAASNDNFFTYSPNFRKCEFTKRCVKLLDSLGFIVYPEKSVPLLQDAWNTLVL